MGILQSTRDVAPGREVDALDAAYRRAYGIANNDRASEEERSHASAVLEGLQFAWDLFSPERAKALGLTPKKGKAAGRAAILKATAGMETAADAAKEALEFSSSSMSVRLDASGRLRDAVEALREAVKP